MEKEKKNKAKQNKTKQKKNSVYDCTNMFDPFCITLIFIAALPPPGDIIPLGAKSRPGSSSESSDSRSHGGSSLSERKRELPMGGVPIAPKKTKLISPTSLTPLGKSVDTLRSTSSNVATKPEIKTIDGKVVLLTNSEQCSQTFFGHNKYLSHQW